MTSREQMLQRFEDAKANNAIEGLILTRDEEALFHYMIDHGITRDEDKLALLREFLAGRFDPAEPLPLAAE